MTVTLDRATRRDPGAPLPRRTSRASRAAPREVVGVAAVVLVFVSISALFALNRPHFAGTDESAHLGYAHVIADARLPTIAGEPPVPESAVIWQIERATARDDRYRGVWVANHPPLFYAAMVPAIWLAELTDRPDGGLLFMRFGNIAFAAVGVVFTYLIGVRVTGVRRIGLAASAVAAFIGLAPAAFSLGLNDGAGFAAGSAVLWAGVRCLQAPGIRPRRRDLAAVAGAASVAAGMRAATMFMAIAVTAAVVAAIMWSPWSARGDRWRAARGVAVAGAAVPLLLFGWFYVRNQILYGDIGASAYLLERFTRVARGSVLEMSTEGQIWSRLFRRVTTPSTVRNMVMPGASMVAAVAVAGLVIAFRQGRTADRRQDGEPGEVDRVAVSLLLAGLGLVVLTVAQHLSGGGMAHSRYLFPALATIAVVVAVGVDQVAPRIAPAAVVVSMAAWSIASIPTAADRAAERRRRAYRVDGFELLREVPGSTAWRAAFATLLVSGCVLGAAVLIAGIARPAGPGAPDRRPALAPPP